MRQVGPEEGEQQRARDDLCHSISNERAGRSPARNEDDANQYESQQPYPLTQHDFTRFTDDVQGVLMHGCAKGAYQDVEEKEDRQQRSYRVIGGTIQGGRDILRIK